jgi:hypothetical protein
MRRCCRPATGVIEGGGSLVQPAPSRQEALAVASVPEKMALMLGTYAHIGAASAAGLGALTGWLWMVLPCRGGEVEGLVGLGPMSVGDEEDGYRGVIGSADAAWLASGAGCCSGERGTRSAAATMWHKAIMQQYKRAHTFERLVYVVIGCNGGVVWQLEPRLRSTVGGRTRIVYQRHRGPAPIGPRRPSLQQLASSALQEVPVDRRRAPPSCLQAAFTRAPGGVDSRDQAPAHMP